MNDEDKKKIFVWRSENMTKIKPDMLICLKCQAKISYQQAIIDYSMKHLGKIENRLSFCGGAKRDEDDYLGIDFVPKWCPYLLEQSVKEGNPE